MTKYLPRIALVAAVLAAACAAPEPAPAPDASAPHKLGTDYPANLVGDVTGAPGANTLAKIQGFAVPSVATGYLFYNSGAFTWNAGSSSVSGGSITGGTADQLIDTNHAGSASEWFTAGGDITFASHNFTVVSISGSTPIAITPASLQWVKGTASPTLTQAAPTTDVATTTLSITSQPAWASASTNKSAGTLALDTGTSVAGGSSQVNLGAANAGAVGIGRSGITTTVTGGLTQTTGAFSLTGNAASQMTTTAGNTTIDSASALNLATSTATSVAEGNSANTTAISQTVKSTGAITNVVGSTTVSSQGSAAGDFSGYGTSFGTNGHVRCTSTDDCVDSPGTLNIGATGATTVAIGSTGATGGLNLTAASSSFIRGSAGVTQILAAGANSSDFLYLGAAADQLQIAPTGLSVPIATTAGATPASITITPQAPNGSCNASGPCTPGSAVVQLAPVGATGSPTEALFEVARGSGHFVAGLGAFPTAPTTIGGLWLGYGITPTFGNYTIAGDGTGNTYINSPSANITFQLAGANYANMTTAALYPTTTGGLTIGTSADPWGASFFGGGSALNLGYTETAAATGTHNSQDAIVWQNTDSERISTYSAKNFQTYTVGAGHHGVNATCIAVARVVTAGTGTGCTFWATGAHGAPDTTFSCMTRGTGQYNGSTWSSYANPYYIACDQTSSANPASGSPGANVLIWSATNSGASFTIQWAIANDACGTLPPVVDVQSTCTFYDD